MSLKDRLLRATYSEVSGVHSGDGAAVQIAVLQTFQDGVSFPVTGKGTPGPSNPLASKALNASGLKGGACRLWGARGLCKGMKDNGLHFAQRYDRAAGRESLRGGGIGA